jgi:hypothetical protein
MMVEGLIETSLQATGAIGLAAIAAVCTLVYLRW